MISSELIAPIFSYAEAHPAFMHSEIAPIAAPLVEHLKSLPQTDPEWFYIEWNSMHHNLIHARLNPSDWLEIRRDGTTDII